MCKFCSNSFKVTLDYRIALFSLVVPVSAVTAVSHVLCFMTNKLIDWLISLMLLRCRYGSTWKALQRGISWLGSVLIPSTHSLHRTTELSWTWPHRSEPRSVTRDCQPSTQTQSSAITQVSQYIWRSALFSTRPSSAFSVVTQICRAQAQRNCEKNST